MHSFRRDRVDKDQKAVIDLLRNCGASVVVIGQPLDLLIGLNGTTLLAEVKSLSEKGRIGKLRPVQREFIQTWGGSPVLVLTRQDCVQKVRAATKLGASSSLPRPAAASPCSCQERPAQPLVPPPPSDDRTMLPQLSMLLDPKDSTAS